MILGVCAVLAVAACWPREATVGSAYQVKVIDRSGRGLGKLTVHRNIDDYTGREDASISVDAVTDNGGEASFPGEMKRISFAGQALGCARQILSAGAHAGCGTYSDIAVSSNQWVEYARDDKPAGGGRSLLLTMSECPSGDYWTCANALHAHD
jgi:hypothetical protein